MNSAPTRLGLSGPFPEVRPHQDVDTFIHTPTNEQAPLKERVAELEGVLQATVQYLLARLGPRQLREIGDEQAPLKERVAELEGALQATAQYLLARLGPRQFRETDDEQAPLRERVAKLEGALQATVQYLQPRFRPGRFGETYAGRYPTLSAHVLEPDTSLKSWYRRALLPVAAAVAVIMVTAAVYLKLSTTSAHGTTGPSPVVQVRQSTASGVGTGQLDASFVATPAVRPAAPTIPPAGPTFGGPQQDESLTIVVSARNVCWIGATLDGERRIERLLQPGEEVLLHAGEEIVLRVGNAGALALTVNGVMALPLGRQGQSVTTRITLANYQRLLRPS